LAPVGDRGSVAARFRGVEFRILGPVEVVEGGRPLPLGQGRERALLAFLLVHANEVVPSDVLVEELWRGEPPATATKALQVYVSRLRKRIGADVVATRAPGYVVHAGPEDLDHIRFDQLVEEARSAHALDRASKLRDALALWRGPALSDLAYEPWAQAEIGRLEEARLAALEDRIDADLDLGRHAAIVGELEALEAYREARRVLSDELGLEPSAELRELERRILAQDEDLAPPPLDRAEAADDPRKPRRRRWAVFAAVVLALAVGSAVAAVALGRSSGAAMVAPPSSVALVDPKTNRVVDVIPVSDRPTKIALHGTSVWVLNPDARTLTRIDREQREVTGTAGLGGAPSGLAVDDRGVWVTDARTGSVTLIEPERLRAVGQIPTRDQQLPPRQWPSTGGSMVIGLGSIWVASGESTISRVDPLHGRVIARLRPVESGGPEGQIAVGDDAVWATGDNALVTRIDPRRNTVAAQIRVRAFRLNGMVVDAGQAWAADVGNDQVWAIDTITNQPIGTTRVGGEPLGVIAAAGSIWVANSGDGTLSRIDPVSREVVATIPVGGSPNGLAASAEGVWVTVD